MTLLIQSQAFERKDGGFRGVVVDKRTGQRTESAILETMNEARHWVRTQIATLMQGQSWRPGYIYGKYSWTLNVWVW